MGYRHYFAIVDIAECNNIENMTYDDFLNYCKTNHKDAYELDEYDDGIKEEYINFHRALNQETIFEFGKLYYEDTADRIYNHGLPLFKLEETQNNFDYYVPYKMGKDGLLEAINIYKEKIINYYKDILTDGAVQILPFGIEIKREDIKSIDKFVSHVNDELMWWENGAINLDEGVDKISSSWMYEHQIFELVRLYKTIDWDTKCLLFYGY